MWLIGIYVLLFVLLIMNDINQLIFIQEITPFTQNDIFYSFLPNINVDGKFMGFFRINPDPELARGHIQQVYMDPDFKIEKTDVIFEGQDPRIFSHKGKNYVIDNYHNSITLINVDTGNTYPVDLPGKNFSFFSYNEKLYLIYKFMPFELYEFNIDELKLIKIATPPLNKEDDKYRGGTVGYVEKNKVYGFGHKTLDPDHHDIFKWELDMNTLILNIIDINKPKECMNISDPTSIIFKNDHKYLVTAESDLRWHTSGENMTYKNKIYKIMT